MITMASAQEIAILKYGGGGDWYSNPTAVPNLIEFCNTNIDTTIKPEPETVEVGSISLFKFPFLHMTGHGNVYFSDEEAENLRHKVVGVIKSSHAPKSYISKQER